MQWFLNTLKGTYDVDRNAGVPIEFAAHPSTARELCKLWRDDRNDPEGITDYFNSLLKVS